MTQPKLYSEDADVAQNKPKFSVKTSGYALFNVDIERLKDGDSSYEAKVKLRTNRKNGVSLRLDVEIDSDSETYIKKLEFNHKKNWGTIKVGKLPKEIGVEELRGKEHRNAVHRSVIYRKLKTFSYTTDEPAIRFEVDMAEDLQFSQSLGFNSANDSFALSEIVSGDENNGSGLWLLHQLSKTDEERQLTWAQTFSLWRAGENLGGHFELFHGVDPFESEVEAVIGTGRKVRYGSFMGEAFYQTSQNKENLLRFFLQAGIVYHDLKYLDYNTHNGILGARWVQDPVQYAVQFELIGTNSLIDPNQRIYDTSMLSFEMGYFF